MIDFKQIGEFFTRSRLWDKPFNQFTKDEIDALCEAVLSAPDMAQVPPDGWKHPYINQRGELVYPVDCHPSEVWWKPGGKSIIQTLDELNAPLDVWRRYVPESLIPEKITTTPF